MRLYRDWWAGTHERVVLSGVILALLWVPVPLGSNRPWAWFAWEAAAYGLLALWALGTLLRPDWRRLSSAASRILLVLLAWLALVFVQTLPMPAGVVAALNPVIHSLQQNLGLISVAASGTLSVDPGTSYNEFLKYGSYVAIFALALLTLTTRMRLLTMVGFVITAGVLEALFGIYSDVSGYAVFPGDSGSDLRSGTFVNRNHYANLLTMSLGLVLGMVTAVINSRVGGRGAGSGLGLSRYRDADTAMLVLLAGSALVIVAGIFVSGSRAPIVFFSLGLALLLAVAWSGKRPVKGELVLAPVMLVAVTVVIVAMGFDDSLIRLLDRDLLGGERMQQNAAGLKLLSAVWPAGVGAGNYQWMLPMFRGDELRFVTYDHAHNDYLQTAIEQGMIVAAVLALGVFLMMREMLRGYRSRRNPVIRGVIFGCLASTVFMLLHALVEFNFRIPANAVLFFVIAGLGVRACHLGRTRKTSRAVSE